MPDKTKVADLTVEDLEALIRRIVDEAIAEALEEDQMEFHPGFVAEMDGRLANRGPRVSAEEARRELGLDR